MYSLLYYLPIAGVEKSWIHAFFRALGWSETQTVSSRFEIESLIPFCVMIIVILSASHVLISMVYRNHGSVVIPSNIRLALYFSIFLREYPSKDLNNFYHT